MNTILEKNKTRIDTVGYDGISISTQMTYDLFRNMYTLVKEQNNNGKINTPYPVIATCITLTTS